jgi:hypothetical protein
MHKSTSKAKVAAAAAFNVTLKIIPTTLHISFREFNFVFDQQ